ncbi:MAG: hypothetical protein WCA39_04750 [Nitrososphaeraceae archaeon]
MKLEDDANYDIDNKDDLLCSTETTDAVDVAILPLILPIHISVVFSSFPKISSIISK